MPKAKNTRKPATVKGRAARSVKKVTQEPLKLFLGTKAYWVYLSHADSMDAEAEPICRGTGKPLRYAAAVDPDALLLPGCDVVVSYHGSHGFGMRAILEKETAKRYYFSTTGANSRSVGYSAKSITAACHRIVGMFVPMGRA